MKMYRVFLAAVVLAMVTGALAQNGAPSDVPRNHWAFEAVDKLFREGLLRGYPDGKFRGNRPASRYEMAGALHASFAQLKGITDNLDRQLTMTKTSQGSGAADDRVEIRRALEAMRNDIDNMKSWGQDINELKVRYSRIGESIRKLRAEVSSIRSDAASIAKSGR